MNNIYLGALDRLEDTISAVGRLMARSVDEFSTNALQARMHELHALKRTIMKRSGIRSNVIHVDFQLKRKVS